MVGYASRVIKRRDNCTQQPQGPQKLACRKNALLYEKWQSRSLLSNPWTMGRWEGSPTRYPWLRPSLLSNGWWLGWMVIDRKPSNTSRRWLSDAAISHASQVWWGPAKARQTISLKPLYAIASWTIKNNHGKAKKHFPLQSVYGLCPAHSPNVEECSLAYRHIRQINMTKKLIAAPSSSSSLWLARDS